MPLVGDPAKSSKTAASNQQGRFYRPELDALRFFAFLGVFLTHGATINMHGSLMSKYPNIAKSVLLVRMAGSFGLSLFFFLSAFIITSLLVVERQQTGTVHLRNFYLRRVLRIWPLYLAYIVSAFIVGRCWAPVRFSGYTLSAYLLLSANWYAIAKGFVTDSIQFLWSISVEEQFYLIWPAAVRNLSRNGIRNFCLGLLTVSILSTTVLAATGSSFLNLWYNSAVELMFFAGGGLLALQVGMREQPKSGPRAAGILLASVVSWLFAAYFVQDRSLLLAGGTARSLETFLFDLVGSGCLLWGFLYLPLILIRPSLIYLGRISYGLYVFQGVALVFGRTVLAPHMRGVEWFALTLLLNLALASLSYEFWEKPFLRLKRRFELVHSRAV